MYRPCSLELKYRDVATAETRHKLSEFDEGGNTLKKLQKKVESKEFQASKTPSLWSVCIINNATCKREICTVCTHGSESCCILTHVTTLYSPTFSVLWDSQGN